VCYQHNKNYFKKRLKKNFLIQKIHPTLFCKGYLTKYLSSERYQIEKRRPENISQTTLAKPF
jgi:hypothetical protein